jgi:hypothetical protein
MPTSFDPSRLRGVLIVVTGGVVIFAAMHYVLGLSLGDDAAAVHPSQRPLGWPTYERIWARISAVDRLYQRGQLPPDTRLGVYIGVSTTAAGIQRQFLDAGAPAAADRWIVLAGAGLSLENIENVMHPVFFCSLKPTTVVLGVHPQMVVGERYLGDEAAGYEQVVGRRRRALESRYAMLRMKRELRQHWAIRHRAIVAHYLRSQIYALRLWVFYLAGISAERLHPPAVEPWDDDPLWLWYMDDVQHEFAEGQINFWRRRGHFEEENYDPDGAQARCLVRMIRAYRALGSKVYLVLMPLRSTARRLVPPIARPCLFEVLHGAFPESPPTVIDLEDAMPDRYFTDEAHLTHGGATRLSKLVASRLQAQAAAAPNPDGS